MTGKGEFKDDNFQEPSGGKEEGWKVLLVSSSRHPDRWIVPGGGMEPEEEPSVAAVREVCEEESLASVPVTMASELVLVMVQLER
ncbi:hypothetical protein A6R68_10759 [Neotoma lepida]|uniref:Nudix hydrolase domain-containing protein n=1 Tax=Neotoma lepida TaxID=56216 RepID=A0A1A6FWX9_NEOLE|nr:hypothetical protein A6R68_10759 [Neotoma lepida]